MSEDIDFAEIDKMMAAMENDTKTKRSIAADVSSDKTVVKKNTAKPRPKMTSVPKTKKTNDADSKKSMPEIVPVKIGTKPKPEEPEGPPKILPNPKTGKFMDLVHPMSDMSSEVRPDRKAPPIVVVKTVATQAISMSNTSEQPKDVSESAVVTEEVVDLSLTVEDALAEFQAEMAEVAEKSIANELGQLRDSVDELADEADYYEFDAPFLENVDVEKRPLGGDSGATTLDDESQKLNSDGPAKPELDNVGPAKKKLRKQKKEAGKLAKTQTKRSKKSSGFGTFLNIILVLSIITLGYILGSIAYLSGMLEGLF